jgi:tetratricopeptide (TPR) repeat protein
MLNPSSLVDDRAPNKRQLAEQAIALALAGKWEEAVETNRRLLTFYPNEADAYNRLGKALTELGRYAEALQAYSQAMAVDPGNGIARRNLDRLRILVERAGVSDVGARGEKIDPRLFVEEAGKTVVTALQNAASPETVARINPGDLVALHSTGHTLVVENSVGHRLGEVESKLAQRLLNFMKLGNRYVAAVKSVDGDDVRIFIRETFQHPSLAGRVTFPTRVDTTHRGSNREPIYRYDLEDEDEEYDEAEGDYVERDRDHHEEESEDDETPTIVRELDRGFELDRDEE